MKSLAIVILLAPGTWAAADSTSGIDGALFRSSYDSNGIFAVEGARLLPRHDLSLKLLVGYGKSPLDLQIPGIGNADDSDRVLDYLVTIDMAFGMTLTDRVAIGIALAAYRTRTDDGYGQRGRYLGSGGVMSTPSTGLIALRPLSNIDQSANPDDEGVYLGDGLAGPLDARAGLKLGLVQSKNIAIAAIGSVFLPFGEDEMLLGDRDLVFEPKLAFEWRPSRVSATRVVANGAMRIRRRTVLESFDTLDPAATNRVILDVGSEFVAGVGAVIELTPRAHFAVEAQAFVPLPDSLTFGDCRRFDRSRCSSIMDADYFGDAKQGDLTTLATAGAFLRVSADVTANVMVGTGQVGARGDDFRLTTGLVWAPQPAGAAAPGRNDRDGDGVPDGVDGCRDEAEDRDGFQDEDGCADLDNDGDGLLDADDKCRDDAEDKDGFEDSDGCPERDNDNDGLFDAADRCPDQPEDKDGFEDEDGCLDEDNDGDSFADARDKCPNDPETVNGVDDDDGCPDVRGTTGPEERTDRIDLKGASVAFGKNNAVLTPAGKQVLAQVATIIKNRKLTIRVEVHVPLGTKAANAAVVTAQRKKDKTLAQQRGKAILDYLVSQGVALTQVQAVGLGSDRPLGASNPTDAANERVDFIKAQQ